MRINYNATGPEHEAKNKTYPVVIFVLGTVVYEAPEKRNVRAILV